MLRPSTVDEAFRRLNERIPEIIAELDKVILNINVSRIVMDFNSVGNLWNLPPRE